MPFAGGVEIRVNSHMQPKVALFEPGNGQFGDQRRNGNFPQTQNFFVELAGGFLAPDWNGHLHVVDSFQKKLICGRRHWEFPELSAF
jgi:hypothetical protein